MKCPNPFLDIYIFYAIFILLLSIKDSHSASIIRKYKKITEDQGLYTLTDNVEILTIDNFKAAVLNSDKAWIVEFYSAWCGFCQRFAPSWKQFGTDIKEWQDSIVVAAVDCSNDINNPLCREYEIMAYPTLRYFHEYYSNESTYGFQMNRGASALEHRQDLLRKMIDEQKEGRGKQFPNLLPYNNGDTIDIFANTLSNVEYAILIIQHPNSYLGPELAMDLRKNVKIITYYTTQNNTRLIDNLGATNIPSLYIVKRNNSIEQLNTVTYDRQGFVTKIKQYFAPKGIIITVGNSKAAENASQEINSEDDALINHVKSMGDVVFQMDLETALYYSLANEVARNKEISGDKLIALQKFLQLLSKYFPFGIYGRYLLNDIVAYSKSHSVISGAHIAELVQNAKNGALPIFSTPHKWLGCRGSVTKYRGYPCGLWKLFHYLTVNVAEYNREIRIDEPRLALDVMHGYIKHFFGCADCREHFLEMANRREIDKVTTFDESIIWLWKAHNEVNKRLSGDATEDPDFPKIQFPSKQNCPKCYGVGDSWNEVEVLKYLKHMYSSINVRYLGADTKVLQAGLQDDSNLAHEGLQTENVYLQTRPTRESITNLDNVDRVASVASAKDPPFYITISVFIVLAVTYAKKNLG